MILMIIFISINNSNNSERLGKLSMCQTSAKPFDIVSFNALNSMRLLLLFSISLQVDNQPREAT